jgi:hypothetical protein
MRYLVRLANEKPFRPADVKSLASSTYKLVQQYGSDVGNVRVSRTAIELDLLLTSKDSLQSATHALEKLGSLITLRELDTPSSRIDADQAIREGFGYFNEERYWESHEALEYAWRRAAGSEKDVLQGVILVAAALVHLQKNEADIALGVIARAREKLSSHHGEHFSISVDNLCATLSRMIAAEKPDFFKIEAAHYSNRAAA